MKKNPNKINAINKIIIPKKNDNKNQELLENLEAISDEDIMKMGEEFEQQKKVSEQEKKDLDLERTGYELPDYAYDIKQNFLKLKGVDKDKLEKIDKFVSELEEKGYVKRCSLDGGLLVTINIPGHPQFKYFEPNFKKHSLGGAYLGKFGPYCEDIPFNFGGKEIKKNMVKHGSVGLSPSIVGSDNWPNFPLYHYIKNVMEKNNFDFVGSRHNKKFVEILGEYYKKCTGDASMSKKDLVAMRSRVLLSGGYWLQKDAMGCNDGVIECYDDNCGFNLPLLGPDEFSYISFLLTDLDMEPGDFEIKTIDI